MNTVQYGDWKITVDIDRTKEYYNTYEKMITKPIEISQNIAKI